MKKLFISIFILLFLNNLIISQTTQSSCLGGNNNDSLYNNYSDGSTKLICKDGGMIVFGTSNSTNGDFSPNHGFADLIAIKLSKSGAIEWKKNFGNNFHEKGAVISRSTDSAFIYIAINSYSSDSINVKSYVANIAIKTALLKINQEGNIIWKKDSIYMDNHNKDYINRIYTGMPLSMHIDSSGNILLVTLNNSNQHVFLKIDNDGNTLWTKQYSINQLGFITGPFNIQINLIDDRYILVASKLSRETIIISLNSSIGNLINYKILDAFSIYNIGTYGSFCKPILVNNGKEILLGGGEEKSPQGESLSRYLCINKYLNTIYDKYYGTPSLSPAFDYSEIIDSNKALLTIDRRYILINTVSGDVIWEKDISMPVPHLTYKHNVIKDRIPVITNTEYSFNSNNTDIHILDTAGNELVNKRLDSAIIINNELYTLFYHWNPKADNTYPEFSADKNYIYLEILGIYGSLAKNITGLLKMDTDGNIIRRYISNPYDKSLYDGFISHATILETTDSNAIGILRLQQSPSNNCNFGGIDISVIKLSGNAFNTIMGKAYVDVNNNNTYNTATDILFTQGSVKTNKGNINTISYLSENGQYQNLVDTGSYSTIFTGYNNYYTVAPVSKTTSHSTYGNVDTVDFALKPKGNIKDLHMSLVNTWVTRPGFTNSYEAVYVNEGTTAVNNASVAVVLDNRLTYNSAVPTPTAIVGDTLKWNIAFLNPSQQGKIKINFTGKVPPTLNGNDSLLSNAIIFPIVGDTTPIDNIYTLTDIARNAFDPNDKNIEANANLTPTQISNGDYITYRVRFQNTGNFYATNVIIKDTLESDLDWSSLQVIAASHTGLQTSVSGNNIVEFKFNNINLPAVSVNEPASHGYVIFKIKPKNNLVTGNIIKNTAHVTFDFNTPIKTTTAIAKVSTITSTTNRHNTIGELNLYPNPNNGNFTIDFVSKGNYPITISLFDVTGKMVYQQNVQHNNQSLIQISDAVLASGLYNIQISSTNDVWNKKVLITK